MNFQKC